MKRTVRACLCTGFMVGLAMGASTTARAASTPVLTNAFLFSNWSWPTTGSSPAFTFMGTDGVELTLGVVGGTTVIGASDIGDFAFEINMALTYAAHNNTVNPGEPGPAGARINAEVGTWDDTGIVNEGPGDAARNVDYRRQTQVVFNPVGGPGVLGYNALIIAEDAAFDPLSLSLCTTAACTDEQTIISGFAAAAQSDILSRPDFVRKDSSNPAKMDQVYLFLFSGDPINAYTAVAEIGNPGGSKLEVDFIGTGTFVPLPGAVWLFGTGLIALAGVARRKRAAAG